MLSQFVLLFSFIHCLHSYRVLNLKDLAHLMDRTCVELVDFGLHTPASSLQRIRATIQDATSHKGPMYLFGYPSAALVVTEHMLCANKKSTTFKNNILLSSHHSLVLQLSFPSFRQSHCYISPMIFQLLRYRNYNIIMLTSPRSRVR